MELAGFQQAGMEGQKERMSKDSGAGKQGHS